VRAEGEMEEADSKQASPGAESRAHVLLLHMYYPELFSIPLASADDRGAPPPQGTHTLGCPEQMPACIHISSSLWRLLRCWIRAQKARTASCRSSQPYARGSQPSRSRVLAVPARRGETRLLQHCTKLLHTSLCSIPAPTRSQRHPMPTMSSQGCSHCQHLLLLPLATASLAD